MCDYNKYRRNGLPPGFVVGLMQLKQLAQPRCYIRDHVVGLGVQGLNKVDEAEYQERDGASNSNFV